MAQNDTFAGYRRELESLRKSMFEIYAKVCRAETDGSMLSLENSFVQRLKRGGYFDSVNKEKDNAASMILGRGADVCSRSIGAVESHTDASSFKSRLEKGKSAARELQRAHYTPRSGEDWDDDLANGANSVRDALDIMDNLARDLVEQLELFDNDCFDSLEEWRRKQAEAAEQAAQKEREAKASATLRQGGEISISWEDWGGEELPFKPADLKSAATDGVVWLATTGKDVYFSRGDSWECISGQFGEASYEGFAVRFINNTWIVVSEKELYVSEDAEQWHSVSLPSCDSCKELAELAFDGSNWILRMFGNRKRFTYTTKGFFFNSKDTNSYYEPVFYRAANLGDSWSRWNKANRFAKSGHVTTGNMAAKDGVLVAAFHLDYIYVIMNNLRDTSADVMYLEENKENKWKDAAMPDSLNRDPMLFATWKNRLLLVQKKLYTSRNGTSWKVVDTGSCTLDSGKAWVGECQDALVLFSGRDSFLFSLEGRVCAEVKLDKGDWRVLAGHDTLLLGVHAGSENDVRLKKGVIHYSKEKA